MSDDIEPDQEPSSSDTDQKLPPLVTPKEPIDPKDALAYVYEWQRRNWAKMRIKRGMVPGTYKPKRPKIFTPAQAVRIILR